MTHFSVFNINELYPAAFYQCTKCVPVYSQCRLSSCFSHPASVLLLLISTFKSRHKSFIFYARDEVGFSFLSK